MADESPEIPTAELATHGRADIPESERAKEIGPEEDADLHADPDDHQTETASEAVATWRVAKGLLKLRAQINALAPNRNKASDGTIADSHHASTSDHSPHVRDGAIGIVTAMDVTHDPRNGCSGEILAEALRAAKDSRIKYIIWNRQIASSSPKGGAASWAWRAYDGTNPHNHHVHLSVKADKVLYDSETAWTLPLSLSSTEGHV